MRSGFDARRGAAAACLLWCTSAAVAQAESARLLRLDAAQAAALAAHPDLEAAAAEQRALEAAERQAALRPNPELMLEVEDVAGSGVYGGVSDAQTTLRVLQPVELGGDRAARRAVAAHRRDVAAFDAAARRLDLLAETTNAFVELLIAQEELHHALELLELAQTEHGAASERVRAGAALGVEASRARVAVGEAEIHVARGRSRLEGARRGLAALLDGAVAFDEGEGDLERVSPPPPLESLLARIGENPDVARLGAEREEREAALALARAKRLPDPRIGGGARHFAGTGDAALVFEVVVPLPVFDRQQGAIAEAAERVAKAGSERAAAERRARQGLIEGHGRWAAAEAEARAIRERVLPDVRSALAELRSAWRAGRAPQLDVLAGQRAEFENIDRLLHVLGEYHQARIACERLAGGFVGELR